MSKPYVYRDSGRRATPIYQTPDEISGLDFLLHRFHRLYRYARFSKRSHCEGGQEVLRVGSRNPLSGIELRVVSCGFVSLVVECLLCGGRSAEGYLQAGGRRVGALLEGGRTSFYVCVERDVYMRTVIRSIHIPGRNSSDFRPPLWGGWECKDGVDCWCEWRRSVGAATCCSG